MSRQIDWVKSDWAKRSHFKKFDFSRQLVKSIVKNAYTNISLKNKFFYRLSRKVMHFSYTEVRNRCKISGRSYFVFSRAGLSRMPFKFLAGCGMIWGVSRRGK